VTRFMSVRFVDPNVLLYAISHDPGEQGKAKRANDLLAARDLALSVQVLQEFYMQATRQTRTEDLGDGHDYGGIRVENPFA
jgi:predicted nucleic acid-binding protein